MKYESNRPTASVAKAVEALAFYAALDIFSVIVDMLSAQIRFLTSSHDANVPFGMEVP